VRNLVPSALGSGHTNEIGGWGVGGGAGSGKFGGDDRFDIVDAD
jgi:hypothetical protein